MSKVPQTFLSYKFLKDSAGVNYLVINSLGENPVIELFSNTIKILSDKRSTSKDGVNEIVATYTGSGTIDAIFKDKQKVSVPLGEPHKDNALPVPFDSLKRSFTFNVSSDVESYDISDGLYYDRDINKQLVIFPESDNPHLDTSSKKDFYYLSTGATAYIASTSLQNQFLTDIKYTNKGSAPEQLGRFRGGKDDNSGLFFTCTPELVGTKQPMVRGAIVSVAMQARDLIVNRVCLDPTASNYYLTGCAGQSLPCTDSGVTHANDCDGIALTSQRLNSYQNVNGGCCEYDTGCDGYNISVGAQTPADTDTANGTIDITVAGGTANFTATVEAANLSNPQLNYVTAVTSGIATSTFTISSLFPGTYEITVTDSTSGTCTDSVFFTIREDISNVDGTYGCKSDSTAINYDSSVGTHDANACVFCNGTTGQLQAGSGRFLQVLGPVFEEGVGSSTTNATSTPSGSSLSDGTISFAGVNYVSPYNIFPAPNFLEFDPAIEFDSSNQSSPIDYRLYKLNNSFNFNAVQQYINSGQNGLTLVTANSTLITTVSGTGGPNVFTALAAGEYAVVAVYDNDGTQDGDDEVEQCYTIFGRYSVGQGGCMSPNSPNYNANAAFDDGSCIESTDTDSCDNLNFGYTVACENQQILIRALDLRITNPAIQEAQDNGWVRLSDGLEYPPNPNGMGSANQYIWWNMLCYHTFNPGVGQLPAGLQAGSPYNIDTNGVYHGGTGGSAWMLLINSSIVMADGTEVFQYSNEMIDYLLLGPPSIIGGSGGASSLLCNYIALHGEPSAVKFSYNYGTADVWEETYEEIIPFTESQINTIISCCTTDTPVDVPGCTDQTALNFNAAATVDDGSCEYDTVDEILGCTDSAATNFNPAANVDDGSCIYPAPGRWVEADCYTCDFVTTNQPGYSTLEECIQAAQASSPCCIAENYEFSANYSSGGSSSTYNSETGLCDDDSTGSISFTIAEDTTSFLADMINPNGVIYAWIVQHSVTGTFYGSWFTGPMAESDIPPISEADVNFPVLQAPFGNQVTVTGVPSGSYLFAMQFYLDGYINTSGNLVPQFDVNGNPRAQCGQLAASGFVNLDNCDDDEQTTIVHGCTDPDATNYLVNCAGVSVPDATVEDGCCEYEGGDPEGCLCLDFEGNTPVYSPDCCPPNPVCGCMDPNALNYNPNANYQDASCPCEYDYVGCVDDPANDFYCDGLNTTIPGCVPNEIFKLLDYNSECIARSGNRFYTKHITGLGSDCSNMETWKMIIIDDLMSRKGLPCLYNCSDESTLDLESLQVNCKDNWIASGSQFWSPASGPSFALGTYVRRPYNPNPLGLAAPIYVAISNTGLDIDPTSSNSANGWRKCVNYSIKDETKDYLPKFLSFAKEYCRDCGIPAYRTSSRLKTTVVDTFNVGGTILEVNGATFDDVANQSDLTDPQQSTNSNEDAGEDGFADLT